MAYALPCLPTRLTDANGNVLAGGKMYVFLAGTITATESYTDSALTIAHANPQIADSGGLFSAAYFAAGSYKIRFTTSADVTIFEIDDYAVAVDGNDFEIPVISKTANFSVQASDKGKAFLVDASAAPGLNVSVSADSETLGANFPFFVVNVGATGTMTILGTGAQTTDGAASQTLSSQYSSVGYVSVGASGWVSVMKSNVGDFVTPVSFANSITFSQGSSFVGGPLIESSGRLTLTTAVPVLSTDVTGATTLYMTPYKGNRTSLYNGTGWTVGTFSEVSQTLADATKSPAAAAPSTVYDVFDWADGGTTFRSTRGPAWATATTRGTGAGTTELEWLHGVLVNKYDITNGPAAQRGRYRGTISTSATGANGQLNMMFNPAPATGGTDNRLDVFNAYNRVLVNSRVRDDTDFWAYTTATIRAANGSNLNRVTAVFGLSEDAVRSRYCVHAYNTLSAGNIARAGVGRDSTSVFDGSPGSQESGSTAGGQLVVGFDSGLPPGIGSHFFQALEWAAASGTMRWYGDNGAPTLQQMMLTVEAMM